MAIAAYLDKNESLLDKVNTLLSEDGHTDVASMKGKVQVAMKALQKMQSELGKLGDEDDLPTWWTNKVSTAVSRIDDMSDYLDTQVEDYTHYPAQVKKDNLPADGWITGDPPQPIEFDGSDTKSILDKANKQVEKERGVVQKPFVESNMEFYQLDEKIEGLVTKAKKSGMPYGILKKVYDRGMAAWKTGHRPGTTPQQWAFARVNSFTTKSSGTWGKADKDLAKQVNSSHHPEEVEIDEAMYHHVLKGKVVASGSKSDMMKLVKKNGATVHKGADSNYILNSPGAKVGDIKEDELGMIPKKKRKGHEVLGPESVQEWFESNMTRAKYQLHHGEDWWWKLQEVKESMLEKMGVCCDDCAEGVHEGTELKEKGPCWDNYKQVGMKMKGGKEVPNCVPESWTQEDIDENLRKVKGTSNLYEPRKSTKFSRMKSMMKHSDMMKKKDDEKRKERKNTSDYKMRMYNSVKLENAWGEITEKDDKSGKELNNPTRGDVKKYKVYVKNDKGNVVKVEFGDPNMSIKRDDPEARKNFRARHNCDQKKDKTTAGYWSCKFWSTKSVTDLMKG